MNLLSVIGTGAAFVNYDKAKKELARVIAEVSAERESVLGAIEAYDSRKYEQLDGVKQELYDPNSPVENLAAWASLQVGMLVGDLCRVRPMITLSNMGDKTITIEGSTIDIAFMLNRKPFLNSAFGRKEASAPGRIIIKPKQAAIITFACHVSTASGTVFEGYFDTDNFFGLGDVYPITAELDEIQQRLIQMFGSGFSATVLDIHDLPAIYKPQKNYDKKLERYIWIYGLSAVISFDYSDSEDKTIRRALIDEVGGDIQYMGEWFFPGVKWDVQYTAI